MSRRPKVSYTFTRLLRMRDLAQIDADFRLLGAVWWSIRENGGELSSRQIDELLDERGVQHLRLSRRRRRRRVPINVRSTGPSGVLRHLVTRKHVRDTSVRRRVAGRHYPIHRRRCDTLQHRRFHTGSRGSGVRVPLAPLFGHLDVRTRTLLRRASCSAFDVSRARRLRR